MKLVTFTSQSGGPTLGAWITDTDEILDLEALAPRRSRDPFDLYDLGGEFLQKAIATYVDILSRQALSSERKAGRVHARKDLRILAPVPRPRKVICVGLNYRDHAVESGMAIPESPVIFSKFPTSIIGPDDAVVIPPGSNEVDYEAELAVVIGRVTRSIGTEVAMEHVLGLSCFNDVSARDFQFKDGQWQRGKSCDTFGPFGPAIVTLDEVHDPHALSIRLHLNGRTLQDSKTDQLIFRIPEIVSFLSQSITLEPGDVIATGTPPGVGFARKPPIYLRPGDIMEVEIERLGTLRNPVRSGGGCPESR